MSTIKVTERQQTNSIDDVIQAIQTYGADNVTLHYAYALLSGSSQHNFEDAEKYVTLAEIANATVLKDLFNEMIQHPGYSLDLSNKLKIDLEDFYDRLINISIEKNIKLEYLPSSTSIEQLNVLADKKLVRLYYVENVTSIDLPFVVKYFGELDIEEIKTRSNNCDVIEFIETEIEKEDQE